MADEHDLVMKLKNGLAISQTATIIVLVLIIAGVSVGFGSGYVEGQQGKTTITTTTSQYEESQQTIISFQTATTTVSNSTTISEYLGAASTTVTSTLFQTNVVSENDSLSNLVVANVTVDGFPDSIGINTNTDVVYVEYSFNTTNLAVINGSTDSLITSIPLGSATQATPIVNPDTNTVYIGNVIINGSTNEVSQYYNQSLTFVAADPSSNVVYAMNTTGYATNSTTTIFEVNGSNNKIVSSVSFEGEPAAGDNPIAMNEQTGILYLAVCTNECGFLEHSIIGIGQTSSGLTILSQIALDQLVFNIAVDPSTNMIFVTALQNLLIAINGTTDQIVDEIPITAYANELRGITVDPTGNEIFLAGGPDCQSFSGCGANTLYVVSEGNYGIFAMFTSPNPFILQFDPANNQTYAVFYFSDFVAALRIPHYNETFLLP